MTEEPEVSLSSGNIFADLDVPAPEEMLAKAELARRVSRILRQRHLTQQQAAEVLGIDQPKVSALMRGRLAGFSLDRLLRFLNALDRDVEIVVKRKARTRRPASLRVVAAER
ncbi:MAG: XRE family transcriptional regulator [Candidatus Tectomicrobia bacterium]|uniref:XRE family transcriptional regulator n=1 Tax=Tectimicrobiota bacterium TaxID=2528274 RepID=A0A937W899_UNCTE|nr:XRE family transcriptional regulator [Candidatus Tectomicrobia bacterium]